MADSRPIGVFDSGLGGLTVVRELIAALPNENIVYFGDTDRVPYGTKSPQTIKRFAIQDESFLLSKDVKLIVAACGTVSSVAADTWDSLPVPFIGVVEHAAKAAVKATNNGKIGVLGTEATVSSGAHKREILKYLPSAQVFSVACSLFVPFVEAGWIDENDPIVTGMVERYLKPIKDENIDTLILGCTHYPILAPIIQKVMGSTVTLINMGVASAAAVKEKLIATNSLNDDNTKGKCSVFVSDLTPAFCKMSKLLLGDEMQSESVKQVDISKL